MKKLLFLLFISISCISLSQTKYSTCKGLVTCNTILGTNVDIGAKILIIPCRSTKINLEEKSDSIQSGYLSIVRFIESEKEIGASTTEKLLKETGLYIPFEETLKREFELAYELVVLEDDGKVRYKKTIDTSGKYLTKLPYGNYYFIFRSSNIKVNKSILYKDGVYDIKKVKINSPITIIDEDFNISFLRKY